MQFITFVLVGIAALLLFVIGRAIGWRDSAFFAMTIFGGGTLIYWLFGSGGVFVYACLGVLALELSGKSGLPGIMRGDADGDSDS